MECLKGFRCCWTLRLIIIPIPSRPRNTERRFLVACQFCFYLSVVIRSVHLQVVFSFSSFGPQTHKYLIQLTAWAEPTAGLEWFKTLPSILTDRSFRKFIRRGLLDSRGIQWIGTFQYENVKNWQTQISRIFEQNFLIFSRNF